MPEEPLILVHDMPNEIHDILVATVEKPGLALGEVWRVCVLEFVLERGAFYSPFATATISYEEPVFHS